MTKQTENVLIVAALAGAAWYLYTRANGLTLTGEYENPMLATGSNQGNKMSNVVPNTSTSTWATNVFTAVGKALTSIVGGIKGKPGNTPVEASPSFAVRAGSVGTGTTPGDIPFIAESPLLLDTSLDTGVPFWQFDFDWDAVKPPTYDPKTSSAYGVFGSPVR